MKKLFVSTSVCMSTLLIVEPFIALGLLLLASGCHSPQAEDPISMDHVTQYDKELRINEIVLDPELKHALVRYANSTSQSSPFIVVSTEPKGMLRIRNAPCVPKPLQLTDLQKAYADSLIGSTTLEEMTNGIHCFVYTSWGNRFIVVDLREPEVVSRMMMDLFREVSTIQPEMICERVDFFEPTVVMVNISR